MPKKSAASTKSNSTKTKIAPKKPAPPKITPSKTATQNVELLSGQLHDGESNPAVIACNDYLRLGPGRSLRRLLDIYDAAKTGSKNPPKPTKTHQELVVFGVSAGFSPRLSEKPLPFEPPTGSLNTLKGWSLQFDWKSRAITFDQEGEDEKNALRKEVFGTGLGQDFMRVAALQDIAGLLYSQIFETSRADESDHVVSVEGSRAREFHNLWCHDSKQIGTGEGAERVDIERFNSSILSEFRALLTEIAQETGGRRKGAQLEAFIKKVQERLDTSKLKAEQVERIRAGEHWITVLLEPYMLSD